MKTITSSLFLAMSLLFCASASAGTQTGQITLISVRASDGLVYFYLAGQASGRPQCAANTTYWMIKAESTIAGKQQLAQLLAARATGRRSPLSARTHASDGATAKTLTP